LTRTGGHITYKKLEYDIGREDLAETIKENLKDRTSEKDDGYIKWLEIMFPYIPIDIDMASFDDAAFGRNDIERFKLSYFTNTKSIEGNNFTNPLVKLDLSEAEPYKTKNDKVDSAKVIDENTNKKILSFENELLKKSISEPEINSIIKNIGMKLERIDFLLNTDEELHKIKKEELQKILNDFTSQTKISKTIKTKFMKQLNEFYREYRTTIDSFNIESCI